jgi:hypothetical protein
LVCCVSHTAMQQLLSTYNASFLKKRKQKEKPCRVQLLECLCCFLFPNVTCPKILGPVYVICYMNLFILSEVHAKLYYNFITFWIYDLILFLCNALQKLIWECKLCRKHWSMTGLKPKFADTNTSKTRQHILLFVLFTLHGCFSCPVSQYSAVTGNMATSNWNNRPISAESLKEHHGCEV